MPIVRNRCCTTALMHQSGLHARKSTGQGVSDLLARDEAVMVGHSIACSVGARSGTTNDAPVFTSAPGETNGATRQSAGAMTCSER